jgi:hypothetical protein
MSGKTSGTADIPVHIWQEIVISHAMSICRIFLLSPLEEAQQFS